MSMDDVKLEKRFPLPILGSLFLLSTIALSAKSIQFLDASIIATLGLFLSSKFRIKGAFYSFAILVLYAFYKHSFTDQHYFQLGVDVSMLCSFFITAFSFEQIFLETSKIDQKIDTKKRLIENLEEELLKLQQTVVDEKVQLEEKLHSIQKEKEELLSEHSSILILNDVLRQLSKKQIKQIDELNFKNLDLNYQIQDIRLENERIQSEMDAIRSVDLYLEKVALQDALNELRQQKEQSDLIQETIARLNLKEILKVKELESENSGLHDLLSSARQKISSLQEEIAFEKAQHADLTLQLKEKIQTLDQELKNPNPLYINLEQKLQEKELVCLELENQRSHAQQTIEKLQIELTNITKAPSAIEPLYIQLKKQFEEKNQILHQVRSELFVKETEMEKLKIENEQNALKEIPKEIEDELIMMGQRIVDLENENSDLSELISHLSSDQESKKKKLAKRPVQTEVVQDLLF